jgi:hypothetical protein
MLGGDCRLQRATQPRCDRGHSILMYSCSIFVRTSTAVVTWDRTQCAHQQWAHEHGIQRELDRFFGCWYWWWFRVSQISTNLTGRHLLKSKIIPTYMYAVFATSTAAPDVQKGKWHERTNTRHYHPPLVSKTQRNFSRTSMKLFNLFPPTHQPPTQ